MIKYLSGLWLDPIANKEHSKAESRSTENLKSGIDYTNKVPFDKNRRRIVMSLDVLNIEVMKRIIYKIVNNSSILSEDWKQMMIFIKDRINIGKIKERG